MQLDAVQHGGHSPAVLVTAYIFDIGRPCHNKVSIDQYYVILSQAHVWGLTK